MVTLLRFLVLGMLRAPGTILLVLNASGLFLFIFCGRIIPTLAVDAF